MEALDSPLWGLCSLGDGCSLPSHTPVWGAWRSTLETITLYRPPPWPACGSRRDVTNSKDQSGGWFLWFCGLFTMFWGFCKWHTGSPHFMRAPLVHSGSPGMPLTWSELHSSRPRAHQVSGPLVGPGLLVSSRSLYLRSCTEDGPSIALIDAS